MKKWFGILVMGTALLFMLTNINKDKKAVEKLEVIQEIVEPSYEYNILVDSFNVIKGSVKRGQTMGEILYLNHIDHFEINKIVEKSKGIFDVRRVNTGKNIPLFVLLILLKRHNILSMKLTQPTMLFLI